MWPEFWIIWRSRDLKVGLLRINFFKKNFATVPQVFGSSVVIQPADAQLFIVPQDRPLAIAAQVPPTDIDLLTIEQEVAARFSALDHRTTPELYGKVALVSARCVQRQRQQCLLLTRRNYTQRRGTCAAAQQHNPDPQHAGRSVYSHSRSHAVQLPDPAAVRLHCAHV